MTSWIFLKVLTHNRQVIEPLVCFVIFITKGAGPLGVIVIFMEFPPSLFEGVLVGFGFVDDAAITWFNGFHFEEVCKKKFSNRVKDFFK